MRRLEDLLPEFGKPGERSLAAEVAALKIAVQELKRRLHRLESKGESA